MITDYSSVAFDFGYMNKSVIYYQFDYDEYREKQLQEGYYKYETDGFGPVCKSLDDVLSNLKYTNNDNNFFERKDNNNSKRLYDYLKEV
jgi:CDP-glycerol glycerophosphotransferase (TagB/SpsB family)